MFYTSCILNILEAIFKKEKFERPMGKQSPKFSTEEVGALADLLFFKPPNIVLKIYARVPKRQELPFRRKLFVNHLIGDAKGNAAKAARLAGYSPKSAKQIAHKFLRS